MNLFDLPYEIPNIPRFDSCVQPSENMKVTVLSVCVPKHPNLDLLKTTACLVDACAVSFHVTCRQTKQSTATKITGSCKATFHLVLND